MNASVSTFKIDAWIRKPACRRCKGDAAFQRIDRAQLGTGNYSSYFCAGCISGEGGGQ